MPSVTAIPARVTGAGRTVDLSFPSLQLEITGGNLNAPSMDVRPNGAQFGGVSYNTVGTGGGGRNWTNFRGSSTYACPSGAALADYHQMWFSPVAYPIVVRPPRTNDGDDHLCARWVWILALNNLVATTGQGGECGVGFGGEDFTGAALHAGACLTFDNTAPGNRIRLRTRQVTGAGTTFDAHTAVTDINRFNALEFRIISATQTQEAWLQVYINNRRIWSLDWPTYLPPITIIPGTTRYFQPWMQTRGGAGASFHLRRFRGMTAPTEDALL